MRSSPKLDQLETLWERQPSPGSWYILLTVKGFIKVESHPVFQFSVTLPVGTILTHRCLISHKEAHFSITGDWYSWVWANNISAVWGIFIKYQVSFTAVFWSTEDEQRDLCFLFYQHLLCFTVIIFCLFYRILEQQLTTNWKEKQSHV